MRSHRSVTGTVVGRSDRGLRVEVLGLFAALALADGSGDRAGQAVDVRITRMDADEGRIFVSDRLAATGQLSLPLT
jgi:hypothetical protein